MYTSISGTFYLGWRLNNWKCDQVEKDVDQIWFFGLHHSPLIFFFIDECLDHQRFMAVGDSIQPFPGFQIVCSRGVAPFFIGMIDENPNHHQLVIIASRVEVFDSFPAHYVENVPGHRLSQPKFLLEDWWISELSTGRFLPFHDDVSLRFDPGGH